MKKSEELIKRNTYRIMALCLCAILSLGLFACGNTKSETSEDIKEETPIDTEYGIASYAFLSELTEQYPYRESGTEAAEAVVDYIVELVKSFGVTDDAIETEKIDVFLGEGRESRNIVVTLPGNSETTIIVGAHYDSVRTKGTDDNGSGVALLLESIKRNAGQELPFTVRYIFFGAEEIGCIGSYDYSESMTQEEIENTRLMVNVDSISIGDYCYIYGGDYEDSQIVRTEDVYRAYEMGIERGMDLHLNTGLNPAYPEPMTIPGCSDYYSFSQKGIPYIYFEATNWEIGQQDGYDQTVELGEVMHSKNDDMSILEELYPGRIQEHMTLYSELLQMILTEW